MTDEMRAIGWIVPIDTILVEEDKRLRKESFGDLEELARSMETFGQLQPIQVEPLKDDPEYDWRLVDGHRRIRALRLIQESNNLDSPRNLDEGMVKVSAEESSLNPMFALQMEFHANEDREDFTWLEKARFVRRIHEGMLEREDNWNVEMTGSFLNMSAPMVYKYLELTDDPELLEDEDIRSAQSYRTAAKKVQIKKEKKKRKQQVELREKRLETDGTKSGEEPTDEDREITTVYHKNAKKLVHNKDAREFMESIPDEFFDWFHWDPPYGGEQAGGAFTTFEDIDDSEEYADALMQAVLPEIYRTLNEDGWLALWFHPARYAEVRGMLEDVGFWVNPYPCVWYKQNRKADGHEIRRYLTNAYETFLLASKRDGAVIQQPHLQNVLVYNTVPRGQRRHIMHKPKELLGEVISILGPPASIGGDCSFGSGSIFEAAFEELRYCIGTEILEDPYLQTLERVEEILADLGKKNLNIDFG